MGSRSCAFPALYKVLSLWVSRIPYEGPRLRVLRPNETTGFMDNYGENNCSNLNVGGIGC